MRSARKKFRSLLFFWSQHDGACEVLLLSFQITVVVVVVAVSAFVVYAAVVIEFVVVVLWQQLIID